MDNAWIWLGRARTLEKEIAALQAAGHEARESENRPALESVISRRVETLNADKAEILTAIGKLRDGRQRAVLTDYYIRNMTLEQTAVDLNYSYAHTKRMRAQAVAEIGKMLKDEPQ